MPTPALKSLADKAGVSLQTAEKAWDEAKAIAKKEKQESDPLFWGLVTTITKNKLGLKEENMKIENKISNFLGEDIDNKYKDIQLSKSGMIGVKGTTAISAGVLTQNVEKKFFSNKSFKSGVDYVVDYDTYQKIAQAVRDELKAWHKEQGLPYYGK
jgi:hypothetical protein